MADQQPFSSQEHKGLSQERKAASRVTFIGMVLDGVLGLIKVIAGTLFHSQALVVDGIHSFTRIILMAINA